MKWNLVEDGKLPKENTEVLISTREKDVITISNRSNGQALSGRALRLIVKTAYHNAGITSERKTAHSLRHTAITKAIQRGAKPTKVQSMARHKSLDTTMIYYHELDRPEDPAEDYIRY